MTLHPPLRLAAIDLDGTLLDSRGQLSNANAEALRKLVACGVMVAAATARWREVALRPFQQAGVPAAAIACAGADVTLADGSVLGRWPMDLDAAVFIVTLAEDAAWVANLSQPGVTFRLAPELPPWGDRAPSWLKPVTHGADLDLTGTLSVLVETTPDDPALARLEAWRGRLDWSWALAFDGKPLLTITAAGVDKGRGLLVLAASLGMEPREVAAFGDSEVDLPMLAVAGVSVAMGNAPQHLQDAASFVTGTADTDGFAAAVERILARTNPS
jgi:hydroxymethylpyrimidine pyrophosphatase-like HAD family hydrolase